MGDFDLSIDGLDYADLLISKDEDGLFTLSLTECLGHDGNVITTARFRKEQLRELYGFLDRHEVGR